MVGFTTVRDLGAADDTIFKLRKSINDGDIIGPRILSAGSIIVWVAEKMAKSVMA
jgi:imidazolonepropionase-like amidohydrolase